MKNLVYGVVIALCVIVAGVVFFATRSGGGSMDSLDDSTMIWVKCRGCGQSYEMSEKQYYEELNEAIKASPTAMMFTPPLKCQKCGKKMLSKAVKCANCGEVFFEGSVPNDYPDRCPKCKHSNTEDSRKARLNQ